MSVPQPSVPPLPKGSKHTHYSSDGRDRSVNVVLRRARTFNQLLHPHCHLHSALRKLAFSSKLDRLDSWHWGRWLIPLGIFIFHSPFLAYSIFFCRSLNSRILILHLLMQSWDGENELIESSSRQFTSHISCLERNWIYVYFLHNCHHVHEQPKLITHSSWIRSK